MVQPLRLELGVTRFFGFGDIANDAFLTGWAWPEENHNWNDGFEAALMLALPSLPDTTYILRTEVQPYLSEGIDHQDVTFYFNGRRLGFWRLENSLGGVLEVELEPEFWLKRDGGGCGKCVWHLPDSRRPSDVIRSEDSRLLGLCFQSLTITRKSLDVRRRSNVTYDAEPA